MKHTKIIYLLLACACTACTHKSAIKHESGVIVEKQYSPSFDGSGTSVGFTSGGHMVVTDNSIHKDEQFTLVFKCQHNTVFSINRADLYARLNKGDTVDIQYMDVINYDNQVVDYDFVTATKTKTCW